MTDALITQTRQLKRAEEYIIHIERQRELSNSLQKQSLDVIDQFLRNYYDGMRLDSLVRRLEDDRNVIKNLQSFSIS